jgi:DNA-binding GntR family transcriptional regulator
MTMSLTPSKLDSSASEQFNRPTSPELSSPMRVARSILEGLYQGRYVPGQRLAEGDLMRTFAVSRGSVREALNRLEAEGVVTLTRNKGAYIRALTRSDADDALAIVEVVIGLAARLAAEHIDAPGSRTLLESFLARLSDNPTRSDWVAFVRARNGFYRALVKIGGNKELGRLLPGMQVHLLRVQFRSFLTMQDEMRSNDYERMSDAILKGKGLLAEREARRHIRNVRSSIVELTDEAFAQPLAP